MARLRPWAATPLFGAPGQRSMELKQLGPGPRKTNPPFVFSWAGSFERPVRSPERYDCLHRHLRHHCSLV
jgi:hypothetical protein